MSYIAFALKYRPQDFNGVIGQRGVVVSLKNAILKEHIHHAYLFSGPRGVGKTSLARIFAKALNCSQGPAVEPCRQCLSCMEIAAGTSLDIIEIDGASNRGIDEIRELREGVKLSPVHSRYKIYIIDEVHMLTQEAFNALLKTLEEPPAHVKFIFATTHPQKVLPTILSRCQRFQFNLISLEEIVAKLRMIISAEGVAVDDRILYSIGRAAAGGIRDAESLLDQIVPVVLAKQDVGDVLSFLGVIEEDSLNTVIGYLIKKELSSCLDFIDKIAKEGRDLGVFINALLDHFRNFLLAKVSPQTFSEIIDIAPQSKEDILNLCKTTPVSEVIKIIELLIEVKDLGQKLNTLRIPLELAVIKFTYQGKEDLLPKSEISISAPVIPKAGADKPRHDIFDWSGLDSLDLEERDNSSSIQAGKSKDSDGIAIPKGEDNIFFHAVKVKWETVVSSMQKVRAAVAAHLSLGRPVSSQANLVKIGFAKKDYFHKESLEDDKKQTFIEEMFSKFIGKEVKVKFVFHEDAASQNSKEPAPDSAAAVSVSNSPNPQVISENKEDDAFINDLLDAFGGNISSENE